MFPGAGASVYYNEAGEPLGWDYPDDGPQDPDDFYEADYDDQEPDEPDGMHDYEDGGDFGTPCRTCGKVDSQLHW